MNLSPNYANWGEFWKYFINLDFSNYAKEINKYISARKDFFVFLFGRHNEQGLSWCPHCINYEPFVHNIKNFVLENEKKKEIFFLSIPVDRDKKSHFIRDSIIKLSTVPSLIYFEKGVEYGRLSEKKISTQELVNTFVKAVYNI